MSSLFLSSWPLTLPYGPFPDGHPPPQAQHQPLVVASSSILEAQLEQLINRHLSRAMDQGPPAVRTITSTPLRSEGRPAPQVPDAVASQETSELGDLSSSSEGTANGSSTALLVSTDAVHRRIANTPPVGVLPPRVSRSSSRSSSTKSSPSPSEPSTPSGSQVNSPASRRQKANKFFRMFRSADGPLSPPSPVPSSSASTQSLPQAGLDEPDLGVPPDSDSFLAEVRNILDLSANSGSPSSPNSNGGHCRTQVGPQRPLAVPQVPSTPQAEVRVGRDGARYTKLDK